MYNVIENMGKKGLSGYFLMPKRGQIFYGNYQLVKSNQLS